MAKSAEELNALAWGNQTGTRAPSSAESLNGLTYTTSPFAAGIQAADYALIHGQHAEVFRCWAALDIPGVNRNGKTYEEIELGVPGKGFFYNTQSEIVSEEYGILPAGTTAFSCLSTVARLGRNYFILRSDPAQFVPEEAQITRGETDTDPLPFRFVTAIRKVTVDGDDVPLSHVQAVSADSPDNDDLGGLKWLSGAPAAGTTVYVSYEHQRLYACLGEMMQGSPVGSDGELLPQRVVLKEERD